MSGGSLGRTPSDRSLSARAYKPLARYAPNLVEGQFSEVRVDGVLGSSVSVSVGRQTVVAVGADAVVFLAGFFYRIHVYDRSVQVGKVV